MGAVSKQRAALEAKEKSKELDDLVEGEVMPEERRRKFRTPGFSRMTIQWTGDDADVVKRAKDTVEGRILRTFADAYEIMFDLYAIVREPEVTEDGEPIRDKLGLTLWRRSESGGYEEDWGALTRKQKEDFLFKITTRLFDWEQRSQDAWGEALLAKARWEERFAISFDAPMAGTVDDRNAKGNINSTEERYLAIYLTWYSRKAEAIVRTMTLLSQRLKDTLEAWKRTLPLSEVPRLG